MICARVLLAELASEEWMDADELSAEGKALIEERIAEHEPNPAAAILCARMEALVNLDEAVP